jgi:hypothetical protein
MSKKDKKKHEGEQVLEEGCCCGSQDECGCGGHGHEGSHHGDCCGGHDHGGCGCEEEVTFERQFYTRDEKIQMLEEYLADLKAEQQGVEEALALLRKEA